MVQSADTTDDLGLTQHAIEGGSTISDHAIFKPTALELTLVQTEAPIAAEGFRKQSQEKNWRPDMNPFEMVIGIILIVTIGSVLKARYQAKHGILEDEDEHGNVRQRLAQDPDKSLMAQEIKDLKERIHVLERIATDNHGSSDLKRQIEDLRDR